jgi:hypothetical protein
MIYYQEKKESISFTTSTLYWHMLYFKSLSYSLTSQVLVLQIQMLPFKCFYSSLNHGCLITTTLIHFGEETNN